MKANQEKFCKECISSHQRILNHISILRGSLMNPFDILNTLEEFIESEKELLTKKLYKNPIDIEDSFRDIARQSDYLSELLQEVAHISNKLQNNIKNIKEDI